MSTTSLSTPTGSQPGSPLKPQNNTVHQFGSGSNGSARLSTSSNERTAERTTKYSPKNVMILLLISPTLFLATAALQQLHAAEYLTLFLQTFFFKKDIPFAMAGVLFFWAYVVTASLSVLAQAVGLKHGYDNSEPRIYKSNIRGALGRVIAAHQVTLESVPAFFAAIIIAAATKVPLDYRISFSVLHTFLRILHTLLYILNFDIARTIAHVMSISCCVWLFVFALVPSFERDYYSTVMDVVTMRRDVLDGGFWSR